MKQLKIILTLILIISFSINSCKNDDDDELFNSKSEWLELFFNEVKNYDDIYAISYWHEDFDDTQLKVNSSEASLNTFKNLINSDDYISSCKFENNKLIPIENKKYFASFPDFCGEEDCVSEKIITDYETLIGKEIAWAYFSNNWNDTIVFPYDEVQAIINTDKTPFIRMMPRSEFEEGRIDPIWNLNDIISGKHDEALTNWFEEAKNTNQNLLVEFGTEVNGFWFSWNATYYGKGETTNYGDTSYPDGAEIFRDAYRHIINLSKQVGANNLTWFFHFDVNNDPEEDWNNAKLYYPGDDYIDWLGVSIYGPMTKDEDFNEYYPADLIDKAYNKFQEISKNKPYAILEFGVTEL
ncbi:MAG: hypothetical protein GXO49_04845 [Chlorobi bacterium]|nr:hypothetical protein [Chlorobiota bacterium]